VNWPAFVGLAVIAAGLGWAGSVLQGKARTRSYTLWRDRIAGNPLIDRTHPRPGRVTEIRNGVRYQRALQYIKWRALPAAAAAALALVIGWLGLAAFTQYSWSRDEPTLCEASATAKPVLHVEIQRFSTSDPCMAVAKVERGHRYEIALTVTKPWTDYGVPADPIGVRRALWAAEDVKDPPLWKRMFQWLGSPYRRVVDGRYLQPVVKLRASDRQAGLLPRTSVHLLTPTTTDKVAYTDVFDANADGELFLFVNDAAVLGWRNGFYANNEGTARVTITDLDPGSVVGGIVDKPGADAKPEDAEPAVGGPKSDASRR